MGDPLPKGDKLNKVFDGDALKNVHLGNPEVLMQSHSDRAVLLLRQVKDFRSQVFGSNPIKPDFVEQLPC